MHQFHITVTEAVSNLVNCINSVHKGSTTANGDKGIHIGSFVPQILKAVFKILNANEHNGNAQKQLGKPVDESVFHSEENGG